MNNTEMIRVLSVSRWLGMLPPGLFVGAYFVSRAGLETVPRGSALAIGFALLPVPFFIWMLVGMIRGIRQLDELVRRIQIEALAFGFLCSLVFLMVLGLMELAIDLPKEDLSYRHVWAMMPTLYFIGLALAWRRYR